jgi:hypothetical protein
MSRIFRFVIVAAILFSCEGNEERPGISMEDFFPLKKGLYFLYDVDETQISLNVETHSVYQMKVAVSDSFKNEVGGYTYVVSRFKRTNATSPWTPLETWSAHQSNEMLVIKEGNTSYVALASPLFVNEQWNGNALNDMDSDVYKLESVDGNFSLGDKSLENILTVVENDDPDLLIKYDVRKVKYAKTVGIVYVEKEVLQYCTESISCYGTRFVNNGLKYKQTLKEYGKE